MPLHNDSDQVEVQPPAEVKPTPVTKNSDYQDNVVDSQVHPITELVTHIDGYPWTVDYYSQVLGADQMQEGQDLSGPDVLQSYTLVKELELKVSAPLDRTQDEETKEFTIVGTAFIYAGVIPNVGDMFIANIGDGRLGVLELTSAIRLTHLEGSCYEVSYRVVSHLTDERKEDLDAKVVRTLIFHKDRLENSTRGVLTEAETVTLDEVKEAIAMLLNGYYHTFYDADQRTLLLPESNIYDPHVVRFMSTLIGGDHNVPHIRELVLSYDKLPYDTIYSSLLNGNVSARSIRSRMRKADSLEFSNRIVLGGVAYSKADSVVFPYGVSTLNDHRAVEASTDPIELLTPADPLPNIRPVEDDEWYVFSQNFYTDGELVSVLEREVKSFMDGDAVNTRTVLEMAAETKDWMIEDYFYFTPILLMLLKTSFKEL